MIFGKARSRPNVVCFVLNVAYTFNTVLRDHYLQRTAIVDT